MDDARSRSRPTRPTDSAGKIMTDTTKPGEGVLDAAISPNGKQMAVVNLG